MSEPQLRFAVDFFAVDFLAVDFRAVVFLAGAALAAVFRAVVFRAVVFFAGAALAAVFFAGDALATTTFGSFLAPDTTFFRSAPARNFGMAVFFALIRSPVLGLRTQRASLTTFSNAPKPVMATFSPRATSRVMVSRTDSSALWACFLFPSK